MEELFYLCIGLADTSSILHIVEKLLDDNDSFSISVIEKEQENHLILLPITYNLTTALDRLFMHSIISVTIFNNTQKCIISVNLPNTYCNPLPLWVVSYDGFAHRTKLKVSNWTSYFPIFAYLTNGETLDIANKEWERIDFLKSNESVLEFYHNGIERVFI